MCSRAGQTTVSFTATAFLTPPLAETSIIPTPTGILLGWPARGSASCASTPADSYHQPDSILIVDGIIRHEYGHAHANTKYVYAGDSATSEQVANDYMEMCYDAKIRRLQAPRRLNGLSFDDFCSLQEAERLASRYARQSQIAPAFSECGKPKTPHPRPLAGEVRTVIGIATTCTSTSGNHTTEDSRGI